MTFTITITQLATLWCWTVRASLPMKIGGNWMPVNEILASGSSPTYAEALADATNASNPSVMFKTRPRHNSEGLQSA